MIREILHLSSWYWLAAYVGLGWCIRLLMFPALLRREFAPGAAIAWLGIIALHPYIGLALYMSVGETRLGPRRTALKQTLADRIRASATNPNQHRNLPALHHDYDPMIRQAEKISGLPIVGGNQVEFIANSQSLVDHLVADIDAAKSEVNLLYYTFATDATARQVANALIAAAGRGVKCRLLVDAVASRTFLHHGQLHPQLIAAGIEVVAALPVAPFRRRLPRVDLRNHRKLAIIDRSVAFIGSQNIIDPDYGGRTGAPWVDLTARVTGPVVIELLMVFVEDWAFETGDEIGIPIFPAQVGANTAVAAQVVPTAPGSSSTSYRRVLLAAVQCAQSQITLTTPYFVPDEPTLVALQMAADRGVDVTLILPKVPDHMFTAAAGRAHFARLMESGVNILLFRPGLIHAKTVTVDNAIAIIGSANLDVRSFNINFELSLILYGESITTQLHDIQKIYQGDSDQVELEEWNRRPILKKYAERALSLLSPLL